MRAIKHLRRPRNALEQHDADVSQLATRWGLRRGALYKTCCGRQGDALLLISSLLGTDDARSKVARETIIENEIAASPARCPAGWPP